MQRVRAIRFSRTGGPEVLTWEEVTIGSPAAGQVFIKHTAVGLNFIDRSESTRLNSSHIQKSRMPSSA